MADVPGPGTPRTVWGVAALLLATGDALGARFGALAVRGELSGFSRAASGHCYFTLKDAAGAPALLRCAMFRRAASLLDFAPAEAQQVELRGRLSVYDARGELQVVVEALRRVGEGALYEEFLRLRDRLAALGLFDAARKRTPVAYPRAVGVVTSLGAAALRDVLTTLARRAPHVRVVLYPALVQGAQAPAALVQALQRAGARAEVDTLLLVRGGGSLEDLWAFNDESVVRAVAASPLPLICGVGHETDVSLCDLAADVRAATPTAAAELAAPSQQQSQALLGSREAAMARAVERAVQLQAQRLDSLGQRLGRPAASLSASGAQLATLALRLRRAAAVQVQRRQDALAAAQARLQALDPQRVLQRGYAWVEGADGRPVVSVAGIAPGQVVQAVWADGRASAQVLHVVPSKVPLTPGC